MARGGAQMISVRINGEERQLPDETSVADLVRRLGLDRGGIAVEVDRAIVPRSAHERHVLRSGDVVEIVTAVGGG